MQQGYYINNDLKIFHSQIIDAFVLFTDNKNQIQL